jgi:outer membrane protein, heavy metal efflux system
MTTRKPGNLPGTWKILVLAAMMVAPRPALSQQSDPNRPVLDGTVESFVRAAVDANPTLAAASHRADATRYAAKTHGVLPDPMIAFGYYIETPETRVGPQQWMVALNQRLPFFGKLGLDRTIATRTADIADRAYDRQRLDLRYDVERAFYEYYGITHVASVLNEELDVLTRMEQVAQVRYASGLVSQQDALKAQIALSQVQDEINVINSRQVDAETRMNTLLNRPPDSPLPAPVSADSVVGVPSAEALIEIALQKRPEVQSAQVEIERAHDAHTLAHRDYFPDLTVGAQYVQVGERDMAGLMDNGKDIFQVNASINIPLWIGRRSAAVDQADADAARARSEKMSWEVRIRNDVQDACERVRLAGERVALYRGVIIPQAEQAFHASEADYQTGKADFLSYLDSERVLLAARRQYFTVVSDYGAQRATLSRTVGAPLEPVR